MGLNVGQKVGKEVGLVEVDGRFVGALLVGEAEVVGFTEGLVDDGDLEVGIALIGDCVTGAAVVGFKLVGRREGLALGCLDDGEREGELEG